MAHFGFVYVENLTWLFLSPNHDYAEVPARYFNKAHLTLLFFRCAWRTPPHRGSAPQRMASSLMSYCEPAGRRYPLPAWPPAGCLAG